MVMSVSYWGWKRTRRHANFTNSVRKRRLPALVMLKSAELPPEALPVVDLAFHGLMRQASHPFRETLGCVGLDLLTQLAYGLIHRQDQWPEDLQSLDQSAVELHYQLLPAGWLPPVVTLS